MGARECISLGPARRFCLRAGGSVRNSLPVQLQLHPHGAAYVQATMRCLPVLLVCTRDRRIRRALSLPTGARFPT